MEIWEDRFIRILEKDEWVVDYDKEKKKYRVSYFEEFHFCDEIWFDAYKEKEDGLIFPHTIGDITFYNKDELFEWVKNQQKLNEILIQEGYLKTQHTCSEKWFVKNKNLNI